MDILRVLSTPDLEVRKKTLQLALDLVSSRNVEEVRYSLFFFSRFFVSFLVQCLRSQTETGPFWMYCDVCLLSSW